jgi:hypothetical protein
VRSRIRRVTDQARFWREPYARSAAFHSRPSPKRSSAASRASRRAIRSSRSRSCRSQPVVQSRTCAGCRVPKMRLHCRSAPGLGPSRPADDAAEMGGLRRFAD